MVYVAVSPLPEPVMPLRSWNARMAATVFAPYLPSTLSVR